MAAVVDGPVTLARRGGFPADLTTVAGRALRSVLRDPEVTIPALIIPVFMYIMTVGALNDFAESIPGLDYKAFQLPVAVLFAVTGVSRAITVVTDIQSGYFDRLVISPVNRLALLLEFFVGVMLVGMGAQVVYSFLKKKVHQHSHGHEEEAHLHFHSHAQAQEKIRTEKLEHHTATGVGKPFLRKKSYLVGLVHGVAGSAALALLVLASIESALVGLVYIVLFGLGSILAMGVMPILISFPFVYSANRLPNLNRVIQFGVGTLSILFGLFLMYEIGLKDGLLYARLPIG